MKRQPTQVRLTWCLKAPTHARIASQVVAEIIACVKAAAPAVVAWSCTFTAENPGLAVAGASHLLEYMAFKTTRNRTHLRLVREVESIGGNVLASGEPAAWLLQPAGWLCA
jgi:ssRNA-specific RNase YbeY (16S rRNA maturation enzyme)